MIRRIFLRALANARRTLRKSRLWPAQPTASERPAVSQQKTPTDNLATRRQTHWTRLAAFLKQEQHDLPRIKGLWKSIRSKPLAYKDSEFILITGKLKTDQQIMENLKWLEYANRKEKELEQKMKHLEAIQKRLKRPEDRKKVQKTLGQLSRRQAGLLTKKMHFTQHIRGLLLSHLFPGLTAKAPVPFNPLRKRYKVQ